MDFPDIFLVVASILGALVVIIALMQAGALILNWDCDWLFSNWVIRVAMLAGTAFIGSVMCFFVSIVWNITELFR